MKRKQYLILIILLISLLPTGHHVQAKTKVQKVVEHARKCYYSTEKKIKKKKLNIYKVKGEYCDYCGKNRLYKTIVYGNKRPEGQATGDQIKNHTAEYFYDKNHKLVFVFAYRKVNGKVKEYRGYFGSDGKIYRYIGPDHKIKNYKKGRNCYGNVPKMAKKMYLGGYMNLHYHGLID